MALIWWLSIQTRAKTVVWFARRLTIDCPTSSLLSLIRNTVWFSTVLPKYYHFLRWVILSRSRAIQSWFARLFGSAWLFHYFFLKKCSHRRWQSSVWNWCFLCLNECSSNSTSHTRTSSHPVNPILGSNRLEFAPIGTNQCCISGIPINVYAQTFQLEGVC